MFATLTHRHYKVRGHRTGSITILYQYLVTTAVIKIFVNGIDSAVLIAALAVCILA